MNRQIDKNIKPPPPRVKWPFVEMAVGESCWFPVALYNISAVRSRSTDTGSRLGRAYRSELRVEKGVEGLRVWRIT